jgi:hypothetical protein
VNVGVDKRRDKDRGLVINHLDFLILLPKVSKTADSDNPFADNADSAVLYQEMRIRALTGSGKKFFP